jgi:hypothetical protein
MNKTIIKTMEEAEKKEANKVEFKNSKKLKSFLQSAMNTATSLTNYIPKITEELIAVINQYQKNMNNKITLKDDKSRFDTFKSLREFSYGLVDYSREDKNNINKAFEMIVERSIRSALMSVNNHGSIQIVDGELVAESKAIKPITKKENHDKRIKKKFITEPNKDTTLIPVNTTAIDDMWKRYNGTDGNGSNGNKSNIKSSANKFYNDLIHVNELAKNKKYEEFYSAMSEDALATILDIKVVLSSELIRNTYKYCEENLQPNGSIKKAS